MRKSISTLACLATTLAAILIVPSSIIAGPLLLAGAGRLADDSSKAEDVACYGFGWRGWGVYPGWFRPACAGAGAAPGYVVPAVPAYAPVAPVYPAAGRCWVAPQPDGRPGYWAAC
jgi:hypothetical protein